MNIEKKITNRKHFYISTLQIHNIVDGALRGFRPEPSLSEIPTSKEKQASQNIHQNKELWRIIR